MSSGDGLDLRPGDDRSLRAGRRDDDIGCRDAVGEIVPRDAAPVYRGGQHIRMRRRAAGHEDLAHAVGAQMLGRQRADLARPDDEHPPAGELTEDLSRERDGGEADRYRAFAESGFAS